MATSHCQIKINVKLEFVDGVAMVNWHGCQNHTILLHFGHFDSELFVKKRCTLVPWYITHC
jgi:hypothetical protein